MSSPIEQLKERVLNKKGKNSRTELTTILDMVREFQCLGEIIGRDFEIRDAGGKLVYTIRQKPMAIKQLNTLLKEAITLKNEDQEREAAKWGTKGKGTRLNKK
jgi:hypothetical protein